jgi:hypothetical protein
MCCNIIYFNSFVHQKLTKFVLDPDPSLNISTNLKPLIFFVMIYIQLRIRQKASDSR